MAVTYGFEGNLWHCFLAFCLANNENVYSTSCEIVGHIEGSLNELAAHDFNVIRNCLITISAHWTEETAGQAVSGPLFQTIMRPTETAACLIRESGIGSLLWPWNWSRPWT